MYTVVSVHCCICTVLYLYTVVSVHCCICTLLYLNPVVVASLLGCLYQLRQENQRLEDHISLLTSRRDQLLAVNARLSVPFGPLNSASTPPTSTNHPIKNHTPQVTPQSSEQYHHDNDTDGSAHFSRSANRGLRITNGLLDEAVFSVESRVSLESFSFLRFYSII